MSTDPIFVLSTQRSGSTLLRVMLAGHPGLFSPPELRLLEFATMRERESALGPCNFGACAKHTCDQRHGLQRALMELYQLDDMSSRQMIDAMLDRNDTTTDAYDVLMRAAAPRRLLDKSTSYATRFETMEKSKRLFPQARYIHLHRHPLAVIESIVRNGFEKSPALAESAWTSRNDNILRFLAGVDQERQIRVPYELLVAEPERTLRSICAFLNIEFHPDVLTPYEGTRMTDGITPETLPPGDWNFRNRDRINPLQADAWRDLDLPRTLDEKTLAISAALAYELDAAVASRP